MTRFLVLILMTRKIFGDNMNRLTPKDWAHDMKRLREVVEGLPDIHNDNDTMEYHMLCNLVHIATKMRDEALMKVQQQINMGDITDVTE